MQSTRLMYTYTPAVLQTYKLYMYRADGHTTLLWCLAVSAGKSPWLPTGGIYVGTYNPTGTNLYKGVCNVVTIEKCA